MKETWLLRREGAHDPFFNMAMDEILLEEAPALGAPLIRIYRWDRPALSIGCTQTYPEGEGACYTIVRRPTGGGNVFHDRDLTYTAVIPHTHPIAALDRMESYRIFHAAMLPMLASFGLAAKLESSGTPDVNRATMKCFVSPSRFDVVADAGAKFAGAAQRRTRNGILHQGSILLSAVNGDWEKLEKALPEALKTFFDIDFREFDFPPEWIDRAERLARTKYETGDWNRAARHQ